MKEHSFCMKLNFRRQMVMVMLVMGLGSLAMNILQPMIPLYLTSIGVTPEIIGLMLSVAMLGMVFGESFWGWVADKTGAQFPLAVGTFISSLAVFCFFLTQNTIVIFTVFFLWGLVRSAIFASGRGYVGANAPHLRKATCMAIITMILSASRSFGALPSGFLADNFGFHAVFFVSCGISLLAGIIVLTCLGHDRLYKIETIGTGPVPIGNPQPSVPKEYRLFATQCIITALQFVGLGIMVSFLPLLATQIAGASAAEVGVLFTIYGVSTMVMSIPMGMIADRIGKKILMVVGLMVYGAGMAGMAFSHSYFWLIVFVLTSGIGMAVFSPAALGMVSDTVPLKWQSTAMGLYGAFGENIGIIAGASLGGFIWIALGPRSTFLMGTVATALGAAFCISLLKINVPLESGSIKY